MSAIENRHSVAELLRFFHLMRREHDGAMVPLLRVEEDVPQGPATLRIELRGRLVEKQDLGIADERQSHRQSLKLPT